MSQPYIPLQHRAETEPQHRADIIRAGQLVFEKGWVAANAGNITVRLGDNRILATPTGVSKGMLSPEDLIITDLEGHRIQSDYSGDRDVTSEMGMHLTIYQERPDIHAVVHAHPPTATGFAVAHRALNQGILPEVIVGLGAVPLAEYGEPGTPALGDSLRPYLDRYEAILLTNHGVIAFGATLQSAYFRMETVEHTARITLAAELLGGVKNLPRVEIQKLFAARQRYGVASKNTFEPGLPLAAEDDAREEEAQEGSLVDAPEEKLILTRGQLIAIVEEVLKLARS